MALVFSTNITPEIPLEAGTGQDQGAGGLLAWLQPTITGDLPLVGPVNLAPYGQATPGLGAVVFYGVLLLAAVGAWKLIGGR